MSYAGLDGTQAREVAVTLSLTGFTKAYDSLK
jgi:hypothetical protein